MNTETMSLSEIATEYHEELKGSFEYLRDMVLDGRMTPSEFLTAQAAIYRTYKRVSLEKAMMA